MNTLRWNGAALLAQVADCADDALAVVGAVAVTTMRATAPVDTGALQASERCAPPGFDQDESARYVPDAGGLPTPEEQGPEVVRGLVAEHHLWVGSWIYYAYWVERGTSHPNYPAQPHIAAAGDAAMLEYGRVFAGLWAARSAVAKEAA